MALSSAEHRVVQAAAKGARNDRARDRRAAGGLVYRKVPVVVSTIETVDAAGAPLVLATSDAPNERGRYFRVTIDGGRWRCACAAFSALGGCHHVGHMAAQPSHSVPPGETRP